MATFYLLPTRASLGRKFNDFLAALFPGLQWPRQDWPDMAETLAAAADAHRGIFVVFREDLADEHDPELCLARDFGAEPGDNIIEIPASNQAPRRWVVAELVPNS